MAADLEEKTARYRRLLQEAIEDVTKATAPDSFMDAVADDYLTMARSYHSDGMAFMERRDLVNALVCFSYGHAWLDAGARLGIFKVSKQHLFAA